MTGPENNGNGSHFEHSPELDQLATALAAAQGEFEVVAKTATNPFFKSKFADLPAVVKAATPVLSKHGLSVSQLPGHDAGGDTLTTIVLHKSGQFLASTMQLRPVKNDPQSQGSATTYGRRYSFMAALGLVADEDDDGNAASAGQTNGAAAAPKPAAALKVQMVGPAATKQLNDQLVRYNEAGLPFNAIEMQAVALGGELDIANEETAGLWHLLTRAQGKALYEWMQEQTAGAIA